MKFWVHKIHRDILEELSDSNRNTYSFFAIFITVRAAHRLQMGKPTLKHLLCSASSSRTPTLVDLYSEGMKSLRNFIKLLKFSMVDCSVELSRYNSKKSVN
jgi:hypothetical protein